MGVKTLKFQSIASTSLWCFSGYRFRDRESPQRGRHTWGAQQLEGQPALRRRPLALWGALVSSPAVPPSDILQCESGMPMDTEPLEERALSMEALDDLRNSLEMPAGVAGIISTEMGGLEAGGGARSALPCRVRPV